MSFHNRQRQRPYNPRRHIQPIAYRSSQVSQPTASVLSRPHAMHPNLQKLRIDPPVLLLLILCIIGLLLWISFGVYMSIVWYIDRIRTVRYGLEKDLNPDILMAKLGGRSHSDEEEGRGKFGQAAKWFHSCPKKTGYDKLEKSWTEKPVDLSRHQSVSSGCTLVMRGDDYKRVQSLGCRRKSIV